MIVLIIVLTVLLVLFTGLLLAPVQIIVDSQEPALMIRVVWVGSAAMYIKDGLPLLQLKGFFLTKDIHLNKTGAKSSKPGICEKRIEKKEQMKKRDKKPFSKKKMRWILRLFRIPGSFRLIKINVNIDSGDYILNAYMYPVFDQLHNFRPGWSWSVNYFGQKKVYLILQSSLIRMIYVYFK